MFYRTFISCFFLILLYTSSLYSQYNEINPDAPPWINQSGKASVTYNPYTTGYAFRVTGQFNTSSQMMRFSVGNPTVVTDIGSVLPYLLGNADFANPEGVWKFYAQDQYNAPYTIYEIDTATGTAVSVGAPTNFKTGHRPRDMEWDHTTNTMYIISQNSANTELQLYSMYWPTKELTWIGPTVTTAPLGIQAGGFNANGTYFGVDVNTDALWRVNKFTGVWTQVGLLGRPANYFQDAGFDRTNFSKMLWIGFGDTLGLYEVDTATGRSTLIGPFNYELGTVIVGVGFAGHNGPQITHTPLQNTQNLAGPYAVNAVITPDGSGIASSKIYWSRNNQAVTDSITMTNSGGNNWTGNIPGNGSAATYRYYIFAKDLLNRTVSSPFNAPSSLHTFNAMSVDTVKPVISHTPLGDLNILLWPCTVSATVTDNLGIDSVWVRWRINSGSEKYKRLPNISGNLYSSLFNSTYADVHFGDTIRYRIIAQDNSISHLKDSTALNSFRITSTTYTCIGTGSERIAFETPFNTFYPGFKTQMLWTASEIAANGGGPDGYIKKVGFFVLGIDTTTMYHFNLKLSNTTVSSLYSGFINSGWTTVFVGTYKITATGWNFIDLPVPFYWDGVSNLLVETCFGKDGFVNNGGSAVQGTAVAGMMYYGYREDTLACTVNPASATGSSLRPNVCFFIDHLVGGINSNYVPASFSLHQNYPNPFNPFTKISYDIPKQGFVTLRIYDLLGREVKTLVSEIKLPGSYSVDYNAAGLPSGVYLYRIECAGFIDTKRMILLK